MFLENNSSKLARNDFVQRDIPINYSMPSPLNSPLSLPRHSLFTSPSAYFTDKGISFLPLSCALRRAHERYSGGESEHFFSLLPLFLFFVPSRAVNPPSLFFSPVVRSRCCNLRFSLYAYSSSSFVVDNRSGFPITMSIVLVSLTIEASARGLIEKFGGERESGLLPSTKALETKASFCVSQLVGLLGFCIVIKGVGDSSPPTRPSHLFIKQQQLVLKYICQIMK